METAYVGAVMLWAGSYVPVNWRICNGQTLAISDFEVLYSLIGNTYGGNPALGNFNLPNFQYQVPTGTGVVTGPFTPVGQMSPQGTIIGQGATIQTSSMPPHTHNATFTPSGVVQGTLAASGTITLPYNGTANITAKGPAKIGTTNTGSRGTALAAGALLTTTPGAQIYATSGSTIIAMGPSNAVTAAGNFAVAGDAGGNSTLILDGDLGATSGTATINGTGGYAAVALDLPGTMVQAIICVNGLYPDFP
ncbi:phage tail protein [Nitrospirillum sp. BR 11828]|uniref:phage tail protein n=1 Tax=Nitrospirillum sp. BR 11828 TaxID=3104325 RepID=UPI002ACAD162|nr:phage tail protein [Nitrospirillum sp. BR 11828]MDZ5645892.1 phage tail protein [Nitrospirillum sp. BR 11828]